MPPDKARPLNAQTRRAMISHLKAALKRSLASTAFARIPIRRMNRFQYNNAVVDLLQLKRDIFPLPENLMRRYTNHFKPAAGKMPSLVRVANRPLGKDIDSARPEGFMGVGAFPQDRRAEHGFDNRADHLTLSPLLMESFLKLSHSIVSSRDLNPRECGVWQSFFITPVTAKGVAKPTHKQQSQVIQARLKKFLRRAFRRPVEAKTLQRFVAFAENNLKSGASFTETMKTLVGATIASPDFLYLYNARKTAGRKTAASAPLAARGIAPVDDFELASRLAMFLWGSIPDDKLLDLAEAGKLKQDKILAGQIDRMLNDRRTMRFCDSFPSQWLQLDRLISSVPDRKKFPEFYFVQAYRASIHMMLEPLLLFETVYIENRSIVELLAPKFTWQSPLLARLYGNQSTGRKPRRGARFRQVKVLTFRRVALTDPRWGGVITNSAVMTMTSSPTRTQPITRGAWVNAVIFNDPPDPPPADVPPLPKANDARLKKMTLRERLEAHRKRADCAACHRKIDPLGFALENYGPIGKWRDKYPNGRQVDPSGTLFGRHRFKTAVEFKRIILQEKRRFVRGFVAHVTSYALGRELTVADSPAIDRITQQAMLGKDGLRSVLKQAAMSAPFRHKHHPKHRQP